MPEAKPKQEEYPELKAPVMPSPGVAKDTFSPGKMRRFIRHLSVASTKLETQIKAKSEVRQKLENIRTMALNKRTKKSDIEQEFSDFESFVHNIIMDEQKILEEQRRESQEIRSLKKMVEDLSSKLVQLGREYALEMDRKEKKILELRDNLATARMKASEAKDDRQEKIAAIEERIKSKTQAKRTEVKDIETDLKALEDTHKKLAKSGKHPKQDLDRLKSVIDSHKKKLKDLKA